MREHAAWKWILDSSFWIIGHFMSGCWDKALKSYTISHTSPSAGCFGKFAASSLKTLNKLSLCTGCEGAATAIGTSIHACAKIASLQSLLPQKKWQLQFTVAWFHLTKKIQIKNSCRTCQTRNFEWQTRQTASLELLPKLLSATHPLLHMLAWQRLQYRTDLIFFPQFPLCAPWCWRGAEGKRSIWSYECAMHD